MCEREGKGTPERKAAGQKSCSPNTPAPNRLTVSPQFSGQGPVSLLPILYVPRAGEQLGRDEPEIVHQTSTYLTLPSQPGPVPKVDRERSGRRVGRPVLQELQGQTISGPCLFQTLPPPLAFLSQPGKVQYFFESNCKSSSEEIKNSRLVLHVHPPPLNHHLIFQSDCSSR